jgi:hypothetical protein
MELKIDLKPLTTQDIEETWNKIKGIYLETAENILGFKGGKKKRIGCQKKHGQKFKNGRMPRLYNKIPRITKTVRSSEELRVRSFEGVRVSFESEFWER